MEKQIIYEVLNERYLLIDIPIIEKNASKIELLSAKHNGIYQSVQIFKPGFFNKAYLIVSYLIPEKNIIEFNKEINL